MSVKKAILLSVVALAVVPALGQQAGTPPSGSGTSPAPPAPAAAQRAPVDESALRYFAAQGDTRRLEAEVARLRALYPDWSPPADLFGAAAQADAELARMWQLYAEGKISDVRSAIATRQASDPRWVPPPELLTRLDEAEARRRLINASDASQWGAVLRIASDAPGLLTCPNVDVLWRVAEAFAKTNAPDRARDAYSYVLTNCDDSAERLATMQKATQLLDPPRIAELMRLERHSADGGPGEFAQIEQDLLRLRLGHAAERPTETVPAADIAKMEQLAGSTTKPDDALVLGWYLYRHGESTRAIDWFKTALDRDGGAKAAEGYVLSLVSAKRGVEAEPIAYQWRDAAPENAKAYLDLAVSLLSADPPQRLAPEVLAHFAPVVLKTRSAAGAQALGWFAYNTGQLRTAAEWFGTAVEWAPEDEAAAYGLAVVRLRLGDRAGLNTLVRVWGGRSERILALVSPEARRRLERQAASNVGATPATPAALAAPLPKEVPTGRMVATPTRSQALPQALPLPLSGVAAAPAYGAADEGAREVDGYGDGSGGGAAAALAAKRFAQCVSLTDAGFRAGRLPPAEAVARGWCLMELDRPMEAAFAFDLALGSATGRTAEDAAYGKSLAYLRKGMTNAAAVAAAEVPQDRRRTTELSSDILVQRALVAYRDQRYVEALIALDERNRLLPEQADLMILRGWCFYQLNDMRSAERIFKALAATGNVEAMAGVYAILEKTRKIRS